jgi:hypothetical protein
MCAHKKRKGKRCQEKKPRSSPFTKSWTATGKGEVKKRGEANVSQSVSFL